MVCEQSTAHAIGSLEHHDGEPGLPEPERCREPGDSGAHDTHVRSRFHVVLARTSGPAERPAAMRAQRRCQAHTAIMPVRVLNHLSQPLLFG
jgi:hypothetical protein